MTAAQPPDSGTRPTGNGHVPALADGLVRVASGLLPHGPVRDRYRQEHHAELASLEPRNQAQYTVGVVLTAWSLRQAVSSTEVTMSNATIITRKPLLCRLNLHHQWVWRSTSDGGRFRSCERCGKDHGGAGRGPTFIAN